MSEESGGESPAWTAVALALKRHMDDRKVKASKLAKIAGVSVNTIKDILKGADAQHSRSPRQAHLIALAVMLDLPRDYLTRVRDGVSAEVIDAEIAAQKAWEESIRSPVELAYWQLLRADPKIGKLKIAVDDAASILHELTGSENLE